MSTVVLEKILNPWWSNKFVYPYSNLYKREKETLRVLHGMSMDVGIREEKYDLFMQSHFSSLSGTQKINDVVALEIWLVLR